MPKMEKPQEEPEAPPIEALGEAAKVPAKDHDAPAKLSDDEKDGAPEDYSSKAVNKTTFTAYLVIIPTPALRADRVDDL